MEEINQIKEMITDIFDTNAKVMQILQEREADNVAEENQRRRIDDLEDCFQDLEKRMQKGDEEIKELERVVRDLVPRAEQASSLVRNYTRHVNKAQKQCIPRDYVTTKHQRSRSHQHTFNDVGSEQLSQREHNDKTIQNVPNRHNGENNILSSVAQMTIAKGDRKVRFADVSENPQSDDRCHTGKVLVNESGFKRKVTEKEVDNRLHYFRKIDIQQKENNHTVEESKEENGAENIHQGDTPSDTTRMLKEEDVLKNMKDGKPEESNSMLRSTREQDNLDLSLSSSTKQDILKTVSEDTDPAQQNANNEEYMCMGTPMKDDMEVSAFKNELNRKAEMEALKGIAAQLPKGVGPDTVLCLDTSGSMEGTAFQEMISLANSFVDGIRHVSLARGINENIGVCTFGKKTGVRLHLTNRYENVKEVLKTLKTEGPSPIYEGVVMASAACIDRGFSIGRCPVGSRIILISDGRGTPDHWNLMADTVDPNNAKAKSLVNNFMVTAGDLVKSRGHTVYSVPVGDYTEEALAQVARTSGGHIIHRNEVDRLVRFAQLQAKAVTYVSNCPGSQSVIRAMIETELMSTGESDCDQIKMDILTLALKFSKLPIKPDGILNKKDKRKQTINPSLPCVGTRDRRGGNMDCEDTGTVGGNDSNKFSTAVPTEDYMAVSAYMNELNRKADMEAIKGATSTLPRGPGPDTILCLDTSGSMEGTAFQEMISLAINFVNGLEQISLTVGIKENIGVCTFGKKTGVRLHLTNRYENVKEVLLILKAEGPSPIYEGVLMASAACIDRHIIMNNIYVGSRIILISDGRGTPGHWNLMADTVDPNNAKAKLLVNNFMVIAGELLKSRRHSVYSVPVGHYTEDVLAQVARLSGGHIVHRNELNRLVRFAQLQTKAATYVYNCRRLGEEVDRESILRAMIATEPMSPGESDSNQIKMDILTLALKFDKFPLEPDDNMDKKGNTVNTSLPCIGIGGGKKDDEKPGTFANDSNKFSMAVPTEDNMEESVYMDEVNRKAKMEALKAATSMLPRGPGPDTILCLDTSGSMEGTAFQEMISLAINFVDGFEQIYPTLGIKENIGVCTFGKKTGVRLHLTNQYENVKEVLLTLKAEGPSPMYEGVLMASAACINRHIKMNSIYVGSRIILISDGRGTPGHWNLMADTVDPNNAKAKLLVNNFMVIAGELLKLRRHAVYSVPVGDYSEEALAQVARISGGHIVHKNQLGRLVRFAQLQHRASLYANSCMDLAEDVDRESFLRDKIGLTSSGGSDFDQIRMDILTLALEYSKQPVEPGDNLDIKGDVMQEISMYMPCIGTRVRRGPTWEWGNQDCEGPGTVVGHKSDKMVWVEWDIGRNGNVYRYLPGIHDVIVVDEGRVLMAGEEIGVGCKVKRGKDWTYGDQDGGEGTVGVVCRVDPDRMVHVRWPNKTVKKYNFGANGRFDVELINQREPSETSVSVLPPRRREGPIADRGKETRKEMSIKEMNRLNQRK